MKWLEDLADALQEAGEALLMIFWNVLPLAIGVGLVLGFLWLFG